MRLLVLGFGPFGSVLDNPAERLARAVNRAALPGAELFGEAMPVSYRRAVEQTVHRARDLRVDWVLGVGVATKRSAPQLERVGRAICGEVADVDGVCGPQLTGPSEVLSSLDLDRWSAALDCEISEDAGTYVCNAWLHQVAQQLTMPVGFLHIPTAGVDPQWLLRGLGRLLG